jgi:hypothetical protein
MAIKLHPVEGSELERLVFENQNRKLSSGGMKRVILF